MEQIVMICLVVVVIIAIILCFMIAKVESNHSFKCKNCGKEFYAKWSQLLFEEHALNEHNIRCPYCNVKDYCVDTKKRKR